jgi:hypothetical protein
VHIPVPSQALENQLRSFQKFVECPPRVNSSSLPHLSFTLHLHLIRIPAFNMISDWRSLACGLLLAAATVLGSPVRARSPYTVKDTHRVPMKWTKIGTPAPDQKVRLTIGLKQSRFDELERHLNEGN